MSEQRWTDEQGIAAVQRVHEAHYHATGSMHSHAALGRALLTLEAEWDALKLALETSRLRVAALEAALNKLFWGGIKGKWPDDGDDVPNDWETWTLLLLGTEAGDTLEGEKAHEHFRRLTDDTSALRELLVEAAASGLVSAYEDASAYACEPESGRAAWAEALADRILNGRGK